MNSRLALFLNSLAENGRVLVEPPPLREEAEDVSGILIEWETNARRELAFDPPSFHAPAAIWAAQLLYHLCQFTVCREIGVERIHAACRIPCPAARGPDTDWSADLLLRHLPKLFEFARHLSNGDPLVHQLSQLGTTWPLSSVGMPGLTQVQIDTFVHHPALRRLYADRIIAARDLARLSDARVDALVRRDLGVHRGLAPDLTARLFPTP